MENVTFASLQSALRGRHVATDRQVNEAAHKWFAAQRKLSGNRNENILKIYAFSYYRENKNIISFCFFTYPCVYIYIYVIKTNYVRNYKLSTKGRTTVTYIKENCHYFVATNSTKPRLKNTSLQMLAESTALNYVKLVSLEFVIFSILY